MENPVGAAWAVESIDFSSLDDGNFDFIQKPVTSMLNDCSAADTLSTAGESSSWGSSAYAEYGHFVIEEEYPATAAAATEGEEKVAEEDCDDDSESSLTMDDLKSFFVEDQVGIFDPTRDDLPPPKARTDYKGDSQNSFTLDDLAFDNEDENDENEDDDSLGCLQAPSRRKISKRRSTLKQPLPLKGILKNGSLNTRRSSSLTMLMMEDSSMLKLSLSGSNGCFDFGSDDSNNDDVGDEGSFRFGNDDDNDCGNGWSLMQQAFSSDHRATLDLQALEDKHVEFSSVVIYYHPLVVGDNPSVSEGAPLALGWKADSTKTFVSLEAYESDKRRRQQHRPTSVTTMNTTTSSSSSSSSPPPPCSPVTTNSIPKRPRRLEAEERMWLLLNAGVSLHDIQTAEILVNRARAEREATKQQHLLLGNVEKVAFLRAVQLCDQEEEPHNHHHHAFNIINKGIRVVTTNNTDSAATAIKVTTAATTTAAAALLPLKVARL